MKNTAKIQFFEPEEWKQRLRHKRTDIPQINRMLTVHEVADKISLSKSTIYRMIDKEQFPKGKLFGVRNRRWSETEIDTWITNQEGQ